MGLCKTYRNELSLKENFQNIREATENLASCLSAEDQTIQSMPDASPTKWHRAHTTWFFETFILVPHFNNYRVLNPAYKYIFNSYYEGVGPRHPRPARGTLSRPGINDIAKYREHVDNAILSLLNNTIDAELQTLIELGLQHEQQHQELLLMDIKHAFAANPLKPAYNHSTDNIDYHISLSRWIDVNSGIYEIGHSDASFAFDNEGPSHRVFLKDFRIADRPVSVGEYLNFINDEGYSRAEFWLSDGWATVQNNRWDSPHYWEQEDSNWYVYTLHGMKPLNLNEPVCHISYYEAAAYAAWAGKRLPTEFEWEATAKLISGNNDLTHDVRLHPRVLSEGFIQDVWEWTGSAYLPYPGYYPPKGAIGEYNGKFMINQMVMRGRCCATPPGHDRLTYRNFFVPSARWQFSGFRLVEDA